MQNIKRITPSQPETAAPPAAANPAGKFTIPDRLLWRVAILFSLAINLILVLIVFVLGLLVFQIKRAIAQPLIGGLYSNFVLMDEAHIKTTILVSDVIMVHDTMPVVFDLPLQTDTTVVLVQDTKIPETLVYLNGIAVPTNITLPAGTPLNIKLGLTVPVSQTIPVNLRVPVVLHVPVDIPLAQTELHSPFTNLAGLVDPYNKLIEPLPSSWGEFFGGKPPK